MTKPSEPHTDHGHTGEQDFIAKNRALMGKFYFNYAMLIVNSFGLQNALERSAVDIGHFFARCHSSASACATLIRDELAPLGYLRYAPDSNFVMGSYAVLSLMKVCFLFVANYRLGLTKLQLLRPEFQTFLDHEQKTITLVKDVADAFESVAVSPSHTPGLYSAFLRALLAARTDTTTSDTSLNKASHSVSSTRRSTPAPPDALNLPLHHKARPPNSAASSNGSMAPPSIIPGAHATANGEIVPDEFQFASEMGPAADITTFPPIMAPQQQDPMGGMMPMDQILSTEFWDNVLVPGTFPSSPLSPLSFC